MWTVRNSDDWVRACVWVGEHPNPYPFRLIEGEGRTRSQNALLHMWFGQISAQTGLGEDEVKGQMHHRFALPVRLKDAQFEYIWARTGAKLTYEQQCALLASETLGVSSKMTTRELKGYLDQLDRLAAENGWRLTQPEKRSA